MSRTGLVCALVIAAGAAAGCGGSSSDKPAPKPAPRSAAHPAKGTDVRVIRRWVDTLRAGHVEAAASYFAVPVLVQNGTPPIHLRTRAQVRLFNEALPCGARLLRTFQSGRYVAATFRLTKRPGGDCGRGTGSEAATAFVIRDGKIVEWRRVPLPGERIPQAPAPPTSSA
ncbi:MAG: nuclear transport factor 2 family protein [Gaiellaceae bacterium]